MSQTSAIEWTDATWNPVTGCSKVSPGCAHCYAETLSLRFGRSTKSCIPAHAPENVILHPERLNYPRRWRIPRRIFVNSMSDLFHEQVPDEFIYQILDVMVACRQHIFQVLTKRPERMRDVVTAYTQSILGGEPVPNIWVGVSIENQRWANARIPLLLQTPAAVRFLSCEPLLGPVDLVRWIDGENKRSKHTLLDWIIVGGESGIAHRPMHPDWVRLLRDQCQMGSVAYFFKQWGGRTPKAGGRLLDGRTWDEFPPRFPLP